MTIKRDGRWPRLLKRDDAAEYVSLSPTKFDELVTAGQMPAPCRMDRCVRWDREDLDRAIDDLKAEGRQPETPQDLLEKWRQGRDAARRSPRGA